MNDGADNIENQDRAVVKPAYTKAERLHGFVSRRIDRTWTSDGVWKLSNFLVHLCFSALTCATYFLSIFATTRLAHHFYDGEANLSNIIPVVLGDFNKVTGVEAGALFLAHTLLGAITVIKLLLSHEKMAFDDVRKKSRKHYDHFTEFVGYACIGVLSVGGIFVAESILASMAKTLQIFSSSSSVNSNVNDNGIQWVDPGTVFLGCSVVLAVLTLFAGRYLRREWNALREG